MLVNNSPKPEINGKFINHVSSKAGVHDPREEENEQHRIKESPGRGVPGDLSSCPELGTCVLRPTAAVKRKLSLYRESSAVKSV